MFPPVILSRSAEDRIGEVLLTGGRPILLDYFDSVEFVEEISYRRFLEYSGYDGQLPGSQLRWRSAKIRQTVMSDKLKNYYVKYKKGQLAEIIPKEAQAG
jgi:hypothetical protein